MQGKKKKRIFWQKMDSYKINVPMEVKTDGIKQYRRSISRSGSR